MPLFAHAEAGLEIDQNQVMPRPTVAGLLVKRDETGVHVGIHESVTAMLKGQISYTTVGGGIDPFEQPIDAMRRELGEEYGKKFAHKCSIEALLGSPVNEKIWRSTKKSYYWFFLKANCRSMPVLKRSECVNFFWCPIQTIQDKNGSGLEHFSESKLDMLRTALERASKIQPHFFK